MGKKQQLVLEEYQDIKSQVIKIDVADPDMGMGLDLGTLPGCLGFHGQPEPGYVCSSCCHQKLCKETTTLTLSSMGFDVKISHATQEPSRGKPNANRSSY